MKFTHFMNFPHFSHMNCQTLTDRHYAKVMESDNYIAEVKLKGIRAALLVKDGVGTLMTRGGHYDPITSNFPHIVDPKLLRGLNNCILDGELWAPGYEDEEIAGFANSKYQNVKRTHDIALNVFDVICAWGTNAMLSPLRSRKQVLNVIAKQLNGPLQLLPSVGGGYHKELLDRVWLNGGEGIVLKHLESPYLPCPNGKRPPVHTWWKLKSTHDFDVIVIGSRPGTGKFEGLIGSLELGMYRGDIVVSVGHTSGFSDDIRQEITENLEAWMGTVVEVKAAEQSKTGQLIEPRYVRRRLDKPANECVWYD